MTVQIKDIDELARAGQMDRLIEAPYEPDENTAAAKEETARAPEPLPKETLLAVPTVEPDMLPEALRGYAEDCVERGNFHFDYVASTLMVALGSVIGRKCAIFPKMQDDWHEYPNLWALNIGRPGFMKSPAMGAAMKPLSYLSKQAQEEFSAAAAEYESTLNQAKIRKKASDANALRAAKNEEDFELFNDFPAEPTLRRYTTSDVSTASLGVLLQQNPNGILIESDEVVSVFKSFDRESELRSFLLTCWNGKHGYTSDRISRGLNNHIEACCVSWVGGAQPGKILPLVCGALRGGDADDGFLQRFQLVAFPDGYNEPWKNVDRWPDTDAKEAVLKVFESLNNYAAYPYADDFTQGLRFDPEAYERFVDWRAGMEARTRSGDETESMESALQKQRKLVPAMALITQLAENHESKTVGIDALEVAIRWGQWSEAHQRRLYAAAMTNDINAARRILAKIDQEKVSAPFVARDIYKNGWAGISDRESVNEGLDLLVRHRWLRAEEQPTTGRTKHLFHLADGVTSAHIAEEANNLKRA
jgi:putative DNA primase/helicase